MSRFGGKTPSNHDDTTPNEYEQQRLRIIKSNKLKMQTLGIKRIAACVTSLVDSSKPQKRRQKCNFTLEKDGDYVPDEDEEDEREDQTQIMTTNKKFGFGKLNVSLLLLACLLLLNALESLVLFSCSELVCLGLMGCLLFS
ncbi:hypothetical protein SOVF_126690 [Spinacia oleracea]|nr:hypothetical protein SOVF_126690 [Spinacia oleracea]